MIFGVQYYPEHWPEERWPVDANMMQRAGVSTVRMGEFAWSALEPQPGQYQFDWLERAIDLLYRHGIQTILCTPSRTPPPWVFQQYPGVINTTFEGKNNRYGQRYTVGLAHLEFVVLSQKIDRAVIEHFSGHKAIVGWQIDNEIGGFNDCYCERCLHTFQDTLRQKYGTIEKLNQSWGSHFWSFTFTEFNQVPLPANNPQIVLEYRRFLSGLNVAFAEWRANLIRSLDPGKWITTNFQSAQARHTDYFKMAQCLDINGMNHYPPRSPEFLLDYYRGDRGKVLVLEQLSRLQAVDSGPGWMRLWAYRALAHGALGTIFFRWRTCRWGQEQHADGILPHAGQENRRYRELAQMGQELKQIGGLIDGTAPPSQVAIVMSYESRWALEAGSFPPEMDPMADAVRFHQEFLRCNIPVDGLDPRGSLARYRLVIAPRLFLVDEAIVANLQRYVEQGGVLCLTAASGVVDEYNKSFEHPRPGPLGKMAGIEVSDLSPLHSALQLSSQVMPGLSSGDSFLLSDEIHPITAHAIAEYASGWRSSLPAITENAYGKGKVIYLGTALDKVATQAFVAYLCAQAGIEPTVVTPPGVSAHERDGQDYRLLFVLNYTESEQTVTLEEKWMDVMGGESGSTFVIRPLDLRLLIQNS